VAVVACLPSSFYNLEAASRFLEKFPTPLNYVFRDISRFECFTVMTMTNDAV